MHVGHLDLKGGAVSNRWRRGPTRVNLANWRHSDLKDVHWNALTIKRNAKYRSKKNVDQYWVNLLMPMDLRLAEAILERVEWSVERSADAWGAFFLLTDPCWGDLDSPDIRGSGLHETKDNNFENWYQLSACDGHHITSFDSEKSINTLRFNTYDVLIC